ncbi:MAG: uroporphyrinogen-III synthase [Pseudomonadales bacterium]|nr:uroporphyrinogen-III synthase [Pseudomonadales bacterium]
MNTEKPLQGRCILVTRPQDQGKRLVADFEALGAYCEHIPLLEIIPYGPFIDDTIKHLEPETVVFISKSAVICGWPVIRQLWADRLYTLKFLAPGQGTADLLEQRGVRVEVPSQADSEGLLDMPELNTQQRVVIVRGQGGRELLAERLKERGSDVHYLEVYRRVLPETARVRLQALLAHRRADLVILTSGESLLHWQSIAGASWSEPWLLVVSPRLHTMAKEAGAQHIWSSEGVRDMDLVRAVLAWQAMSLGDTVPTGGC